MEKNIDFGFVADIYDDYVTVDFDIPFYKKLCEQFKGETLELMCGTGRVSIPLIKSGVQLTCVDYSQDMLQVFRSKVDCQSNLLCQDVCKLSIDKKFDLVLIPFNSFSEITSKEKRKAALQRIFDHLNDHGAFFCTLYNPKHRVRSADGNLKCLGKFSMKDGNTLLITYYNACNPKNNTIFGTQFYEVYDVQNKLIDKRFLNIEFSLITKDEFLVLCGEVGFHLKAIYGDYEFGAYSEDSMFMNFLLTK